MGREARFVKFVGSLWENHRECFSYAERPWIERITDREEKIFAIVLRTLIWNEQKEQQLIKQKLGGFTESRERFFKVREDIFKSWAEEKMKGIRFAVKENGKPWLGAHRDNRHKKCFSIALFEYMKLVDGSQAEFFENFADFNSAFEKVKNEIYGVGDLTAFDILERLYRTEDKLEAKPFKHHPEEFYLTGGGVIKGLRKIQDYHISNNKELEEQGNILIEKIVEKYNIPQEIVYYEVESILCIYQKDKYSNNVKSEDLLNGQIEPEEFAQIYAQKYCEDRKTTC